MAAWAAMPLRTRALDAVALALLAQILAFIRTGINAGFEGTNRVIKTVAHDAYIFRNPVDQRLRTRRATTRRTREQLDPR
nr:hypothetical protein [Micromonospora cremea]